ncbi:hypothetical protein KW807_01575 [Candidatus Parcubacteria bacterium]|nr:hypothetical protein [Candidatus Parcubacteria bacterium]
MITKTDKILFFFWPLIASALSFATHANFFLATIFFLAIPGIYLSFRKPSLIGKALVVTVATFPIWVVFEYLAVITGTWHFATTIFPLRLFNNIVTIDVMIWYFAWVYLIVTYYEFFLDKHLTPRLYHPKLKYVCMLFSAIFLFFLFLLQISAVPKIPYLYLTFGIIFGALPTAFTLLRFPKLFPKIAKAALYFVFLFFTWELTALSLGHWAFPGTGHTFIGWIDIQGLRFPVEELLVWMLLGTTGIISWFELFDDDRK